MSESSRILSPPEQASSIAAAKAFVDAMRAHARRVYEGFDNWTQDEQTNAVMAQAVQHLVTNAAFDGAPLNLEYTAYCLGLAMGVRCNHLDEAQVREVILQFQRGFFVGRAEQTKAIIAMPTAGNA